MQNWTPKAVWNYTVLRQLLGPATDVKPGIHGYARWDYKGATPANAIFATTNILSSAMVLSGQNKQFNIKFMVEVPGTGIDGGVVDRIYPGLFYINSIESLGVVDTCIYTALLAICHAVLYLTGRQDIRQARDNFIEDNGLIKGSNEIEKINLLRVVYSRAVDALHIDTMETFVNVPGTRSADTNLPMQSEMVKLSQIITESREKKEKFSGDLSADPRRNRSTRTYTTDDIINSTR